MIAHKFIKNSLDYIISFLGNSFSITFDNVRYEQSQTADQPANIILSKGTKQVYLPSIAPIGENYTIEELPDSPRLFSYLHSKSIPILYGKPIIKQEDDKLYCGIDIIGTIFFLLTRWEESVLPKDKFGRCDENQLYTVKHGLHTRPFVNEYIDFLCFLFSEVGVKICRPSLQKPKLKLTHDVDGLFRYGSIESLLRNIGGDILRKKSMKTTIKTLRNYVAYRKGKTLDPYDSFDVLMDISEEVGTKSEFYFIPSYKGEPDARYDIRDPKVKQIIDHIADRGHVVGIHPSMNTYNNPEQFKEEVRRMRNLYPVTCGRHHYLRVQTPETYRMWEDNGLTADSSVGFSQNVGFRSGCYTPYPLFDFKNHRQLSIIEYPLLIMDTALTFNDKHIQEAKKVCSRVKGSNGVITLLFHSDGYNTNYRHLNNIYKSLLYI